MTTDAYYQNPIKAKRLDAQVIRCDEIFADYSSFNTRADFDDQSVATLAADIRKNGQAQNVIVDQISDPNILALGFKYQLRAGFRRFRAINGVLKDPTILALIYKPLLPEEALAINYIENDQRRPLSFHEEAGVVKRFKTMSTNVPSNVQIGALMGKTAEWVRLRDLYLSLPEEMQGAVQQSEITQADLRKLGKLWSQNNESAWAYFKAIRRSNKASVAREMKVATDIAPAITTKRALKVRPNNVIRGMYAQTNRLFPNEGLVNTMLRWILCEADDLELRQAAEAEYVGSAEEFAEIFLTGSGNRPATSSSCQHPNPVALQEPDGRYRAICTACGHQATETAPDQESALFLI